MIPPLNEEGYLPPGIHWTTWDEVCDRFADNPHRQKLLAGLRAALENLKAAGCETVYLDGSFVTGKEIPGDFDGCWETAGVDSVTLDPVLLDLSPGRPAQKAKYLGNCSPLPGEAAALALPSWNFFNQTKTVILRGS